MTTLPQNIKEIWYRTIKGDIPPAEFEQWLYADKEVEQHVPPDDYLDLIAFNFKKKGATYELRDLLKKHIDTGAFETFKMLQLLKKAQQKTLQLPYILMEFYELYCKSYTFLQDLGLGIGLAIAVPQVQNTTADSWEELTDHQQQELLDSWAPDMEKCMHQVINWLETKKIILTGTQDETGHYNYVDVRTTEEQKSNLHITT